MKEDEIIAMAKEAGMEQDGENFFSNNYDGMDVHISDLRTFANLVAAHEREACAKVVEDPYYGEAGKECAAAIRQRGQDSKCKYCTNGCAACDARKVKHDLL